MLSLPNITCTTSVEKKQQEEAAILDAFLDSTIQEASHKPQVTEQLKKPCHLDIAKNGGTKKQPRESKKRVSRKQKLLLGFRNINKRAFNYKDFLPLHKLWKEYLKDFLNIKQLRLHGFTGSHVDKQWRQLSIKLLRADYQGAKLKVIRSRCCSLVGLKGIMVYDTKGTYNLLDKDNIIRIIPKMGSAFRIKLDEYEFTIFGKDMCIRPLLRSVKKIKKYLIADI